MRFKAVRTQVSVIETHACQSSGRSTPIANGTEVWRRLPPTLPRALPQPDPKADRLVCRRQFPCRPDAKSTSRWLRHVAAKAERRRWGPAGTASRGGKTRPPKRLSPAALPGPTVFGADRWPHLPAARNLAWVMYLRGCRRSAADPYARCTNRRRRFDHENRSRDAENARFPPVAPGETDITVRRWARISRQLPIVCTTRFRRQSDFHRV